jgi:hypothetical protein
MAMAMAWLWAVGLTGVGSDRAGGAARYSARNKHTRHTKPHSRTSTQFNAVKPTPTHDAAQKDANDMTKAGKKGNPRELYDRPATANGQVRP